MKVKFLDLNNQYISIKKDIDLCIKKVIESSSFIGGDGVKNFENNFAKYNNSKYCIGVANGTDALEIAIESLKLKKNSEIIVPANSFIASSEAVTRSGFNVVFCKYNTKTNTIDIDDLKARINKNTSAIIAVHLYGHPCEMDEILEIAKLNDIKVIEDCAQAHGALYKNKNVGSIGDISCFSFYPGKNLGAYGDAGCILTNNKKLEYCVRLISNHGRTEKYNHIIEGRNSRLDCLQAEILNVKLNYLDKWINRRRKIAKKYDDYFNQSSKPIIHPIESTWAKHVYHLYVIRTGKRDELKSYLESRDIECGIHYPYSLPSLKAYRNHKQFNMMGEQEEGKNLLSLPIGEHLTDDQIDYVINCIDSFKL